VNIALLISKDNFQDMDKDTVTNTSIDTITDTEIEADTDMDMGTDTDKERDNFHGKRQKLKASKALGFKK
jgi:hypothetical protein